MANNPATPRSVSDYPISKLTRILSRSEISIAIHLTFVSRDLCRAIYSAIPNKKLSVRTLFSSRTPIDGMLHDDLEALHMLSVNKSQANFELRLERDEIGEHVIVDNKWLVTSIKSFHSILSIQDASMISVSTDPGQVGHIATVFDTKWVNSTAITEESLIETYTRSSMPVRPDITISMVNAANLIVNLLSDERDPLPIDRMVEEASPGISSIFLPASLAELARKSVEQRYRDALASHVGVLEHASQSASLLAMQESIHTEIAERYLRRVAALLGTDAVSSELAVAIRHPSLQKGGSAGRLRRSNADWPRVTPFGSEIAWDADDTSLEGLAHRIHDGAGFGVAEVA
jgi:hypothetical protein